MEPTKQDVSVKKLNSSGFGLIEVLIAAVILGVIGVAFSQLMITGMRGQGAVTSNADINNVQGTIQLIMQSPAACNANFPPAVYTFNPAGIVNAATYTPGNPKIIPPTFNKIVFVDGTPAFTYNQTYANYKVTDLELRITANNGPGLYNALIHIELTNQQQVSGSNVLARDIPIGLATTGSAVIQGCATGGPTLKYGSFTCVAGPVTVPFGYTFAAPPEVFVQWDYTAPDVGYLTAVSTTGFTYVNGNTGNCFWLAIE